MKSNAQHEYILAFGNRRIPYRLVREERKRYRITITPDMRVTVSAPKQATDAQIETMLNGKKRWIVRKLDLVESFIPLPAPLRYVSGETIRYIGRQYRLKVESSEQYSAKLKGKYLEICVTDKNDFEAIKGMVDKWYQTRAEEIFKRYMATCEKIAGRHDIPPATFVLRKMQTRWGSCSSKGRIILNTHLIQAPVHCIEYVIMHELCHLKHHNHSPAFYRLLTRCMPDWKQRKALLDRIALPQS
ncbi:M48 family peptidase [Verrucomicrobia bacterium S94]|nr:M48 family peptidase [Verrucomicrobia bacterium S94]